MQQEDYQAICSIQPDETTSAGSLSFHIVSTVDLIKCLNIVQYSVDNGNVLALLYEGCPKSSITLIVLP